MYSGAIRTWGEGGGRGGLKTSKLKKQRVGGGGGDGWLWQVVGMGGWVMGGEVIMKMVNELLIDGLEQTEDGI